MYGFGTRAGTTHRDPNSIYKEACLVPNLLDFVNSRQLSISYRGLDEFYRDTSSGTDHYESRFRGVAQRNSLHLWRGAGRLELMLKAEFVVIVGVRFDTSRITA